MISDCFGVNYHKSLSWNNKKWIFFPKTPVATVLFYNKNSKTHRFGLFHVGGWWLCGTVTTCLPTRSSPCHNKWFEGNNFLKKFVDNAKQEYETGESLYFCGGKLIKRDELRLISRKGKTNKNRQRRLVEIKKNVTLTYVQHGEANFYSNRTPRQFKSLFKVMWVLTRNNRIFTTHKKGKLWPSRAPNFPSSSTAVTFFRGTGSDSERFDGCQ